MSALTTEASITTQQTNATMTSVDFHGVHHVGLICKDLKASLAFYRDLLGLRVDALRPEALPFNGAWLWVGREMIHLLELPDPEPKENRPSRGTHVRHVALGIHKMDPLVERLQRAGVDYDVSVIGRKAIFFRDPDMNCLEAFEISDWH